MSSPTTSSSKYKEILCIEEYGEICVLLSKMLSPNKAKVLHAKDVSEAANYLHERHPAIILIENNFFEQSGITYAADLKSTIPETKIIILSSQDGHSKEAAKKAGIDVFLTKPFTKKQLLDSVNTLLSQSEKP
jgi:DNA-binding response OmpR family regulator